jgi:hypothetical protein
MMCPMPPLREDQEALLAAHRARGAARLEEVVSGTPSGDPRRSDAGQAVLEEGPELLVSVAVCAVEVQCERARAFLEQTPGKVLVVGARAAVPAMLLRVLRRRRLPWAPADVELLLDLAAGVSVTELAFAVAAAEQVLSKHPGEPRVYRALADAASALEEKRVSGDAVRRVRQRIRALVAANAPGGLLDLTVLEEGDGWAAPAAAAARAHASRWEGTQALLSHLASARGTRPSDRWLARARELVEPPDGGSLVRALLEPVPGLAGSPLLTPANERIVCGAAWALGLVASDADVVLLHDVALACAGPARVAARAAVEGLVLAGTHAATEALRGLLGEVSRVSVRERIAEVVEPTATPRRARSDSVRAFGATFLDALAARGFDERKSRECWRISPDRVEAISVRSERGVPLLDVGVTFAAAHGGRLGRVKVYYCDFRGMARVGEDEDAEAAVTRTLRWFEHWRPAVVVDFVLSGEGVEDVAGFDSSGPRGLDTPRANTLVGYLAIEAGRPQLAGPALGRAAEYFRHVLEQTDPRDAELAALVERLEADAAGAG